MNPRQPASKAMQSFTRIVSEYCFASGLPTDDPTSSTRNEVSLSDEKSMGYLENGIVANCSNWTLPRTHPVAASVESPPGKLSEKLKRLGAFGL